MASSTNADEKMKGLVALVTGSSSGIGAAIAIEYCRLGAKVTITGRNASKLNDVAQKCEEASRDKHKPLVIMGDVTDEEFRKKLVEDTVKHFGQLDVLVNNAGNFVSVPSEQNYGLSPLDSMLNIHVRVPYHLSKLAFPHLVAVKGVVINISSVCGVRPIGNIGLEYGVAKAAMDQMTKWFACELGPKGVRVNSINPGTIPTDIMVNAGMSDANADLVYAAAGPLHALKRVGHVDEVARVASFLASKESSFVTGSILPVDGGLLVMSQTIDEFKALAQEAAPK